jgi:hypothetical protein
MTGILLLFGVALWAYACWKAAAALGRRMRRSAWRLPAVATIFVVLVLLPVADEIVGGFQFRSLCAGAVAHVEVRDVAGRVARYRGDPIDARLPGTAIPILYSHIEYSDVKTGELIARYDRFIAKGGLLVRTLRLSESNSPLTMGRSDCSGESDSLSLPLQLGFQVVK